MSLVASIAMVYLFVYAANVADASAAGKIVAAAGAFVIFMIGGSVVLLGTKTGAFPPLGNQVDAAFGGKNGVDSSAIGLVLGIVASLALVLGKFSIFNPTRGFSVFSSAVPYLDAFNSSFITTIAAPLAEEMIFLLVVPLAVLGFADALSKGLGVKFLANTNVKLVSAILVSSVAFLFFHVGLTENSSFVWALLIFRALLIAIIYGDLLFDWVPYVTLGVMAAVGFHIGNNVAATGGWLLWLQVMLTNGFGVAEVLLIASAFAIVLVRVLKHKSLNVGVG